VFVDQAGDKHLVQVCADLADDDTRERELAALAEASGELRCKSAFVVSQHDDEVEEVDGQPLSIVPVWRWLARVSS
jgi:predicted AAA+ superfamily ATPase